MKTSTVVDYENSSHLEGDNIGQITDVCKSNILALLRLKKNGRVQIESVDVTFVARTTRIIPKIELSNDFWLSVALETYED